MLDYVRGVGRQKAKIRVGGDLAQFLYDRVGNISGVNYSKGVLHAPAEPRLLEIIQQFGPFDLSIGLMRWYRQCLEEGIVVQEILLADHEIAHKNGHLLRPYQRTGVSFLAKTGNALLCDDLGLGKTCQAIIAAESTKRCNNVIIVCPNSLKLQWRDEIEKWSALGLPVTVVTAKDRRKQLADFAGGWVIVNYQLFRMDPWFVDSHLWDWAIFDEAHAMKNRKTKTFLTAKRLNFRRIVLLTATPMGNDPAELWALLNLVRPQEYPSYWRFFEMYVEYAENYLGYKEITGSKNAGVLRHDLSTKMLQRKKHEVAKDLPKKTNQTIYVEMVAAQAHMYKQMLLEMIAMLESGEKLTAFFVIAQLTRLRQIVATTATVDVTDLSGKLDAAEEIIKNTNQKIIVFCVYRATVESLCIRLDRLGIKNVRILGGLSIEEREAAKVAINEGDARVLVCTIRSGGVGLNLQGASLGIFISKEWNPMEQEQASGRLHRIGQTRNVHIISLLCAGTIDERVERLLEKKQQMTDDVLKTTLLDELRTVSGSEILSASATRQLLTDA